MSGARVRVENLSLALGAFRLRGLDLALDEGEILVILGPNGAGKSVSLEAIAGFHRANGRIAIGGRDVTNLPPEARNVALVFQDFGLFPHLNVAENVALGWSARHRTAPPPRRIEALLGEFGIAPLAARRPAHLSPGEKQRTALARALAAAPDLFLFDEPFSALDAATRETLREELDRFLRTMRVPAIFVTHDRTDAAVLADRIVVLGGGTVRQAGAAADVLRQPANRFVARTLGIENILSATLVGSEGNRVAVRLGDRVVETISPAMPLAADKTVVVAIRAEDIVVRAPETGPTSPVGGVNRLNARLVAVRDRGALTRLELDCGFPLTADIMAREARALPLAAGASLCAELAPDAIHIMAADEDEA